MGEATIRLATAGVGKDLPVLDGVSYDEENGYILTVTNGVQDMETNETVGFYKVSRKTELCAWSKGVQRNRSYKNRKRGQGKGKGKVEQKGGFGSKKQGARDGRGLWYR